MSSSTTNHDVLLISVLTSHISIFTPVSEIHLKSKSFKVHHPKSASPICFFFLILGRCELGFIHTGSDLQPGLDSLPEPHWCRGPREELQVWVKVTTITQMILIQLWIWRWASFAGLSVWFWPDIQTLGQLCFSWFILSPRTSAWWSAVMSGLYVQELYQAFHPDKLHLSVPVLCLLQSPPASLFRCPDGQTLRSCTRIVPAVRTGWVKNAWKPSTLQFLLTIWDMGHSSFCR